MTAGTDLRFALVPEWLLDAELSTTDVALYCHLARFADARTGACWPSRDTLAERMKVSSSTVKRAIQRLSTAAAITVTERQGTSNLYTVHRLPPNKRVGSPVTRGSGHEWPGGRVMGDPQTRTNELEPENQNQSIAASRPRNEHWDAVAALLGDPSKQQRSLMGRLVAKAKEHPVEMIYVRAERYVRAYTTPLTLAAFEKHWEWLGSPAAQLAAVPESEKQTRKRKPVYEENP